MHLVKNICIPQEEVHSTDDKSIQCSQCQVVVHINCFGKRNVIKHLLEQNCISFLENHSWHSGFIRFIYSTTRMEYRHIMAGM